MALKKYDVFLSFRGEDTRTNFTSHLYQALIQKKVDVFIDNHIEKGDEISPALIQAIEDSLVSIVIFSEDYASSKWCLDELIQILQCYNKDEGQNIVMPVFYNIQPTHVRNQTGSYEKAFAQHERDYLKHNQDKLQKWKVALTEATYIVGYEFPSHKYRNESDLIKDIVDDVMRKLRHKYPFEVEGLIRIENKCEEIESLLEVGSNDVRVIGLWGMGGIGKTTLAKMLCGKLSPQFEGYCFLENVREESTKIGVSRVRHKLLSALLDEENLRFDAPYVENPSIKRKLATKKVFFVLDDVSTTKQIEDLFINNNINRCLGPGSRVIVTTRDKRVFSEFDECKIYEMKELNKHGSLELFCLNAFRKNHPKIGYEELSERVTTYCKGNPLALKVLGARLRSKSKEAWKSELKKLEEIQDVNIHKVLKLSYDDLEYTEQNIFLEIAYFFRGKDRDEVTSLLEACDLHATVGIQILIDKALITISNYDEIVMHDLIQEMAWEMVHKECIQDPGRRSRLWKAEEVANVLKNNKGTEYVEGIKLNCSEVGDLYLSADSFKRMTNLRYLEIYHMFEGNVYFPDGLEWISDKLRYLSWDAFLLDSFPSDFRVEVLVQIHMPNSKLKQLWGGVQNLSKLKMINLYDSKDLIEMPDLSRAPNLETISLIGCENLRDLHSSILPLPNLTVLNLQGCKKIKSLQTTTHSKSLTELYLNGCSSLEEFSVTSEEMTFLSLNSTAISELSSNIWRNSQLTFLGLSNCKKLKIIEKKLPNDQKLRSLTKLQLFGCTQLNATNLRSILDGIQSLQWLGLSNCCNLEAIPENIKNHSMLEMVEIYNCRKLVFSLTEFPQSLRELRASNCTYQVTTEREPKSRVRVIGGEVKGDFGKEKDFSGVYVRFFLCSFGLFLVIHIFVFNKLVPRVFLSLIAN